MYCQKCQAQIPDESKFCPECGFSSSNSADVQTPAEANYKKYEPAVKKINLLNLIAKGVAILVLLSLIFMPIFQFEVQSLNDVDDLEDLSELLKNDGKLNFSLFEDFVRVIKQFSNSDSVADEYGEYGSMYTLLLFSLSIMLIFLIIFSTISICMYISDIIKTASAFTDEKSTLLKYNELKKSGSNNKKENILKKQTLYTTIMYAVMDPLFCKIEGAMFTSLINIGTIRYMQSFCGISGFIAFPIILLAGYIVVDIMKKREEKALLVSITEEEYQQN